MLRVIEEIREFLSSPWQVVVFFAMPLFLTIYFGLVFSDGVIEHTRTVIVDQDQSAVSRTLTGEFRANRGFDIVADLDDIQAAQGMVDREEADLVLAVPEGFSRDLKLGRSPSLLVIADAGNMAISSNALKRANEIIITYNAGVEIKRLEGKGMLPKEAENTAVPLRFRYRQLGNPSGSFYDFLLWGLLAAVAHFPIMLFAAVSLDKEKKPGLREILAKTGAFTLLGSCQLLSCILAAVIFFPVSFHGNPAALIWLVFAFVLALVSMAIFVAMVAPNRVMASQASMIVVLPALLLSGHTWPMSGFPLVVKILGRLEPLTYFADPLRNLALRGDTGIQYWRGIGVLIIFSAVYQGGAWWLSKRNGRAAVWKSESFPG